MAKISPRTSSFLVSAILLLFGSGLASDARNGKHVSLSKELQRLQEDRFGNRRRRKAVEVLHHYPPLEINNEVLSSIGQVLLQRQKSDLELQPHVATTAQHQSAEKSETDADADAFWRGIGMSMPNDRPTSPENPTATGTPTAPPSRDGGDASKAPAEAPSGDSTSTSTTPTLTPTLTPTTASTGTTPNSTTPGNGTGTSRSPDSGEDSSNPPTTKVPTSLSPETPLPTTETDVPTEAPSPKQPGNEAPSAEEEDRTLAPTRLEDVESPPTSGARSKNRALLLGSSIGGALLVAAILCVGVVTCERRESNV